MRITGQSLPSTPALDFERLDREAESAYWLRFLNGRWLIYWHERLIGDFPAENAALALAFLQRKQSERLLDGESGRQARMKEVSFGAEESTDRGLRPHRQHS
jgi:hypothetical protein